MKDNELSYSSKNAEELVKLGQLAFETLDKKCKDMWVLLMNNIVFACDENSFKLNISQFGIDLQIFKHCKYKFSHFK